MIQYQNLKYEFYRVLVYVCEICQSIYTTKECEFYVLNNEVNG